MDETRDGNMRNLTWPGIILVIIVMFAVSSIHLSWTNIIVAVLMVIGMGTLVTLLVRK